MACEEHDWILQRDWGGDPEVVNGTFEIAFARCSVCGEETDDYAILKELGDTNYYEE